MFRPDEMPGISLIFFFDRANYGDDEMRATVALSLNCLRLTSQGLRHLLADDMIGSVSRAPVDIPAAVAFGEDRGSVPVVGCPSFSSYPRDVFFSSMDDVKSFSFRHGKPNDDEEEEEEMTVAEQEESGRRDAKIYVGLTPPAASSLVLDIPFSYLIRNDSDGSFVGCGAFFADVDVAR